MSDDSVDIAQLDATASMPIEVSRREVRSFRITCRKFGLALPVFCHSGVSVGKLKQQLGRWLKVAPRVMVILHQKAEQENVVLLHSLMSQELDLAVNGHCCVTVKSDRLNCRWFAETSWTVLDLASRIQTKLFEESGRERLTDVVILKDGSRLEENAVIGHIFPSGRGLVYV
jgi:hypothetical protein